MRKLYNALKEILEKQGFEVAPYGENTFFNENRSLIIEIGQTELIEPLFAVRPILLTSGNVV